MPAGLEVYDPLGNLKISISHRLLRFLGQVIIPAGSGSGSLTHDGLLTGVPFAVQTMYSNNGSGYFPGDNMYPLSLGFSGNTMYWTINTGQPDQIVQFGVY